VQWGHPQVAWPALEEAAKCILRPGNFVFQPHIHKILPLLGAHRITQVAVQSMYNFDTNNVLTILHNTQGIKGSDPRDRLYAIRGIIEDNEDIEIDYSIPVQQVYRNWAVKRINGTKSLDIPVPVQIRVDIETRHHGLLIFDGLLDRAKPCGMRVRHGLCRTRKTFFHEYPQLIHCFRKMD
jgi:hypothetical protein